MKLLAQPTYVKVAFASVMASALLVSAPFAFAAIPLAPFLVLNWLLFIGVGYFAFLRPFRWKTFAEQPERRKLLAFNSTLLAFTVAGWIALFNTDRIV